MHTVSSTPLAVPPVLLGHPHIRHIIGIGLHLYGLIINVDSHRIVLDLDPSPPVEAVSDTEKGIDD